MEHILFELVDDLDVIRHRQAVFEDLLNHQQFTTELEKLLPQLLALDTYRNYSEESDSLREVAWRMSELSSYVECIDEVHRVLAGNINTLRSSALHNLFATISEIKADESFLNLKKELPALLDKIRRIQSVTIGVNLDKHLSPVEATLVNVNTFRFGGANTMLSKILTDRNGLAQLHRLPQKVEGPHPTVFGEHLLKNPMLVPLFRDLADVLKRVSRPVAVALRKYSHINSSSISIFAKDLVFFLGGYRLIKKLLKMNLPICKPSLETSSTRCLFLKDFYNINLAFRLNQDGQSGAPSKSLVLNDVEIGECGRILIVTGPNRGGKTTYAQGIGIAQLLGQAGLFVPAKEAVICPTTAIFTHFPVEEKPDNQAGRLGEEAQRLHEIFSKADPKSFILLNESLATTSPRESVHLATNVVKCLQMLGVRTVYTTHLHDLAACVDDLNQTNTQNKAVSLVSLVDFNTDDGVRRTYKIVPGPPAGLSYAQEIANKYGISYEQLKQILEKRGLA